MATTTETTSQSHSQKTKDPMARLSLAVRQLDNLIDRANQLANLPKQPRPFSLPHASRETPPMLPKAHRHSASS